MKKPLLFTGMLCLLFCRVNIISAQPQSSDTSIDGTQKAIGLFYQSVNENAHLFNGREYIKYDPRIKGDPYFNVADLQPGVIFYDGTLYQNVPMLYEVLGEQVVIRQYGQGVLITLVNEKIDYFTMFGHTFIHLVPDSANIDISDGFYDRIYNGNTTVFVKRQKILTEDPNTFERSFTEKDGYFIYKNNVYHPVSDRGSVLSVFKDKKKDIAKYLRQNKISFNKTPEYAMTKMAEYYDQLTH